jgi:hypothetical protein
MAFAAGSDIRPRLDSEAPVRGVERAAEAHRGGMEVEKLHVHMDLPAVRARGAPVLRRMPGLCGPREIRRATGRQGGERRASRNGSAGGAWGGSSDRTRRVALASGDGAVDSTGGFRLLSLIPGLLMWFPTGMLSVMPMGAGSFIHLQFPLSGAEWAFLLVMTAWPVACLVVAWGLLERAPWARTYTIVVSAIWLLDFPLGTALSIYTLWVLLPESSENEYRELAMQ